MNKKFFGWSNIRWGVKELIKMYSNEPSFFSYKRFQMGMAFFIFCQGSAYTLYHYVNDVGGFVMWATPILFVAGYTLNKVQQEKKDGIE